VNVATFLDPKSYAGKILEISTALCYVEYIKKVKGEISMK